MFIQNIVSSSMNFFSANAHPARSVPQLNTRNENYMRVYEASVGICFVPVFATRLLRRACYRFVLTSLCQVVDNAATSLWTTRLRQV